MRFCIACIGAEPTNSSENSRLPALRASAIMASAAGSENFAWRWFAAIGIADRIQDIRAGVNFDRVNVVRLYVVFGDEFQHQVDGRMREHAAGIGFDRHAGLDDGPDFAKAL